MNMKACLEINNITKYYGKTTILDALSLNVLDGEIVGLLGHNGAGKSTAFNIIIGLIKPDSGTIFLKESNITNIQVHKRAILGMGYLAQEPSIFKSLTVEENIMVILEFLHIDKKERKRRLEMVMEEMHITNLAKKKTAILSGGEKRRVEIARTLITNPKLLLLDEPFANIDPLTISDMKKIILTLKKRGIAIFITDHNAREIFSIVDRSYLISNGKLLAAGSAKELIENKIAKESYFGEDFTI